MENNKKQIAAKLKQARLNPGEAVTIDTGRLFIVVYSDKTYRISPNNLEGPDTRTYTSAKTATDEIGALSHLIYREHVNTVDPTGNWNTAKDWFPTITVDQWKRCVSITQHNSRGFQQKASVDTEWCVVDATLDALFVRGSVRVANWANYKCSGSQQFCFAVFVGDSGHVYVHRAPATSGWMDASPTDIKQRLRKLGIGAERGVVQQGDFLLKPANGVAYADEKFKHETTGAGHHRFEMPVLYATGSHGRQYKIDEPTLLQHRAGDNVKHPDVTITPGVYIVGTTANSLAHSNHRD